MSIRSILLGGLGSVSLVMGCFVEEPPPMTPPPDDTGEGTTTTTPTTMTEGPSTMTATGSMTDATTDPTTVGMTTIGPGDTTSDGTTTAVSATESADTSDTTGCVPACDGLVCGMEDDCMTSCGECGPMAECAGDQSYCGLPVGFFNDFGDTALVNSQVQLGFRFQVFEPRTVRRLGVISAGAGLDVRLALYDHDGAGPGSRIVQTGAVTLFNNGPNEFEVGATAIMPGEYWVMLHTSGMTPLARTFNGDNDYEIAVRGGIPFGDGFPVNMNDEMILSDYRYNLYMVVEE